MKRTMRVLSLDWDYFIDASADFRARYFPDGGTENISTDLQRLIWVGRYSGCKELKDIQIDKEQLEVLKNGLMDTVTDSTGVFALESHKHLFSVVNSEYKKGLYNKIELYNVDFHHDIYGYDFVAKSTKSTSTLFDCGNWLACLMKRYKTRLNSVWVQREDSDTEILPEGLRSTTDLQEVFQGNWDIVFLCRSGMWSAPHLDDEFIKLVEFTKFLGKVIFIEEGVMQSRYSQEMQTLISQWDDTLKNVFPEQMISKDGSIEITQVKG